MWRIVFRVARGVFAFERIGAFFENSWVSNILALVPKSISIMSHSYSKVHNRARLS